MINRLGGNVGWRRLCNHPADHLTVLFSIQHTCTKVNSSISTFFTKFVKSIVKTLIHVKLHAPP